MRRREFITGLTAAATLPLAARAQQSDRMRRIGVLMSLAEDDAEEQARLRAFVQTLQQLGWEEGRNLRIDARWDDAARRLRLALAPGSRMLPPGSQSIEVAIVGAKERKNVTFAGKPVEVR